MDNREFEVIAQAGIEPATPADDVAEAVARIIDSAAWLVVDEHAPYVARHTIPFEKARVASLEKARAAIAALQARRADQFAESAKCPAEPVMIRAKDGSVVPLVIPEVIEPAGEEHVAGFRDWLAFSLSQARSNLDAMDAKAADILANVLARYDATPSNPERLVEALRAIVTLRRHSREDDADNALTMQDMAERALIAWQAAKPAGESA